MADIFNVVIHGLSMDCSMAAYLTIIPALLIITGIWTQRKWIRIAEQGYFAIISSLLAIITVLDLTLYGYWDFRLDMTPFFYFTTSPQAAMASAEWWLIVAGIVIITVIAITLYKVFMWLLKKQSGGKSNRRWRSTAVMTVVTAALFIPIRGGFTVSTMNLSRAYFSQNQRLNHAAINPAFSLMYSATHQNNFAGQYRFMDNESAEKALFELNSAILSDSVANNNIITSETLLKCKRPDIYLIILESFSAHLLESLGGENIAENLDSLGREGILFSNFYANSFRTDRALPAILSGFPSQPSTSIMKFVEKAERLPSIAGELKKAGYFPQYYYGGDINFTNMNAYLVNSGFEKIVCDKDFSLSERASKWGAPDHLVFERALADAQKNDVENRPQFNVIQTSSSHEPFEVPYANTRFVDDPKKNAFAYTDSCLIAFVDGLKQLDSYNKTLVIMVPDHLGAWPKDLPDAPQRHHVPMVFIGGALNQNGVVIDTPASQNDIAATLLGAMNIEHNAFSFSHDILDPTAPHYAVFSEPSFAGLVTANDSAVINCDSGEVVKATGPDSEMRATQIKAFLQKLYDTIDAL